MSFFEWYIRGFRARPVQLQILDNELVVEIQPIHDPVHAQPVGAGFGGRQPARPAHKQVGDSGGRDGGAEIEVHVAVDTGGERGPGEFGARVKVSLQSRLIVGMGEGGSGHGGGLAQKIGSRFKADLGVRELFSHPVERRGGAGGGRVVVAFEHADFIRQRADHRDVLHRASERQGAGVFEQDHGLAGNFERELAMGLAVVLSIRSLGVLDHFRRIEHTELEARPITASG